VEVVALHVADELAVKVQLVQVAAAVAQVVIAVILTCILIEFRLQPIDQIAFNGVSRRYRLLALG
jgi:hypothetical protein